MIPTNEFGKAVKKRLVDLGKTQGWLVSEVRKRCGGYFDDSWLQRIMTGRTPCERSRDGVSPSKTEIIREVLGL